MRFYTTDECQEWLKVRGRELPDKTPGLLREAVKIPMETPTLQVFARAVANDLIGSYSQRVLLWLVWDYQDFDHSNLYYRLRRSYGDNRLVDDAPGHLFLPHEAEDLASFLFLTMANWCEGYLLGDTEWVNAYITNDTYVDFFAAKERDLDFVHKLREYWPEKKD